MTPGATSKSARERFDYRHLDPAAITDDGWETVRLLVPTDEIGYIVALFEGYANQFLVRTETKGLGFLRIWFPSSSRRQFDAVLSEMRTEFPIEVLETTKGMSALDEVFPE